MWASAVAHLKECAETRLAVGSHAVPAVTEVFAQELTRFGIQEAHIGRSASLHGHSLAVRSTLEGCTVVAAATSKRLYRQWEPSSMAFCRTTAPQLPAERTEIPAARRLATRGFCRTLVSRSKPNPRTNQKFFRGS